MSPLLARLQTVAPVLTRRFFYCPHTCSSLRPARIFLSLHPTRKFSSEISAKHAFKNRRRSAFQAGRCQFGLSNRRMAHTRTFFPETTSNGVAYWLLASAASVYGIVVFGGLTRLTESGLSITEWRPVTGSILPSSEEAWEAEFAKYRNSPEYRMLNPHMTLAEFKKIYWMEWAHRIWGRIVGLSFVLPAAYFIARRKVSRTVALRLSGIGGLIAFQGFLGWWMVKSGLKDDLFEPGSHPRVSQYRLAAHLGTAVLCYSAMLWNGLQVLRENFLLKNPAAAKEAIERLSNPALRAFQRSTGLLTGLVFVTVMSGAIVAGLDAGLIYNDFPWMGGSWVPPQSELLNDFYSKKIDGRDLWWRNSLENPILAQLDHRILATTTFTSIVGLFSWSRFSPSLVRHLPSAGRKAMHGVLGFACLQVALGISTLWYLVPTSLASAHQAGALAVLSYVLLLGNRVWLPRKAFLAALKRRAGYVANRPVHKTADIMSITSKNPLTINTSPTLNTNAELKG